MDLQIDLNHRIPDGEAAVKKAANHLIALLVAGAQNMQDTLVSRGVSHLIKGLAVRFPATHIGTMAPHAELILTGVLCLNRMETEFNRSTKIAIVLNGAILENDEHTINKTLLDLLLDVNDELQHALKETTERTPNMRTWSH